MDEMEVRQHERRSSAARAYAFHQDAAGMVKSVNLRWLRDIIAQVETSSQDGTGASTANEAVPDADPRVEDTEEGA